MRRTLSQNFLHAWGPVEVVTGDALRGAFRRPNVSPGRLGALGLPRDATPGAVPPEAYARMFTALE